ncbi:MAG: hypothetical protein KA802_12505 [Saprospiraceae bacterium]|nr:hypothetical protein [Saprospiraceae bacterium]
MASFDEHIKKAKDNLRFLETINTHACTNWDWQVTVSFYAAVHLANAHIAHKAGLHYQSHNATINALNPLKPIPVGMEFTEPVYLAYVKLKNLSRRARYLCHEDAVQLDPASAQAAAHHLTHDKHLYKSLKCLDTIMAFMNAQHNIVFPQISIDCIEIRGKQFNYFQYIQKI